ncbi:MAG TPA: hypothetical protein VHU19_15370 [Pyrinomonadaceae bacterium]|jgi:hypothetical protein|nr:hypothetical protein [Pyrinomonadaceae bacterium]
MADEKRSDDQAIGHDSTTAPGGNKERTGDPGRTPGKAEGDEETVEEDLGQKGQGS